MRKSIGVFKLIDPPHIVPIQLNTLIPVGTAIIMVVTVKTEFATGPNPTVNMWWLQTIQPMKAMMTPASTTVAYPKSGLRENTGSISDTIPMAGSISMYTSGCPNTQNRCCQSTAFGPGGHVEEVHPEGAVEVQLDQGDSYHREGKHQ